MRAEGRLVHAQHDYQVGLAQLEYAGAFAPPKSTSATEAENHAAQ